MDELFNLLSSSARIDKSKKKKTTTTTAQQRKAFSREAATPHLSPPALPPPSLRQDVGGDNDDGDSASSDSSYSSSSDDDHAVGRGRQRLTSSETSKLRGRRRRRKRNDEDDDEVNNNKNTTTQINNNKRRRSRDRTGKRDRTHSKTAQVHNEEMTAYRRKLGIRLSSHNKHDATVPDPISKFDEIAPPSWWRTERTRENGGGGGGRGGETGDGGGGGRQRAGGDRGTGGGKGGPHHPTFDALQSSLLRNIEDGSWTEPTPIQMQIVPSLLHRRDVLGCAPTGSGKSGAFIIPALLMSGCPDAIYHRGSGGVGGDGDGGGGDDDDDDDIGRKKREKKKGQRTMKKKGGREDNDDDDRRGQVRTLLLAPSRELASQLHREVLRLGETNRPGGLRTALLSKSNAGLATSNELGGKHGLDVLVATPLRLVECLERGMALRGVRLVVLDEADRLLDASDAGGMNAGTSGGGGEEGEGEDGSEEGTGSSSSSSSGSDEDDSSSSDEEGEGSAASANTKHGKATARSSRNKASSAVTPKQHHQHQQKRSGSSHAKTFLEQVDAILASCPTTAVRSLFSATLGPAVRHLAESILRDPIDVSVGPAAASGGMGSAAGGVASDSIQQELRFVGREDGKLLAIRQIVQGGIRPPVIVFVQSKDRAQALFNELMYDGIRVDVIHAGRSQAARDEAVAKFRKGETWILICTDLVSRGVDFKAVNMVINYDLPSSGVTYVHRIGRTGRAGRKGTAITLFTEADFDDLRTIANVMKLSGCNIPEWMLTLKKTSHRLGGGRGREGGSGGTGQRRKQKAGRSNPRRGKIDTTPEYDKVKKRKRKQCIENSIKKKKAKNEERE